MCRPGREAYCQLAYYLVYSVGQLDDAGRPHCVLKSVIPRYEQLSTMLSHKFSTNSLFPVPPNNAMTAWFLHVCMPLTWKHNLRWALIAEHHETLQRKRGWKGMSHQSIPKCETRALYRLHFYCITCTPSLLISHFVLLPEFLLPTQ